MPVQGWRERHDTCRFGTYRPDPEDAGLVVAGCEHPTVGARYDEQFCARDCPAYHARPRNLPKGHIPLIEERVAVPSRK